MNKEEFYQVIIDFIEEKNDEAISEIGEKENLIQLGVIDSFMIIELIMKLEEILETVIDSDGLTVEHISSLESMYYFFLVNHE